MLDESSLITNETAKRSKFILKMTTGKRDFVIRNTDSRESMKGCGHRCSCWGGTLQRKPFTTVYVVTEWVENGDGYKREVITGYKHTEHLKKKLASYGCIFMKTSEVLELPEQTEQKIFFKIHTGVQVFYQEQLPVV